MHPLNSKRRWRPIDISIIYKHRQIFGLVLSLELKYIKNDTSRRYISGKKSLASRTLFDSHPLRTRTVHQMRMTTCTPLGRAMHFPWKCVWLGCTWTVVGAVFCWVRMHDRAMLDQSLRFPRRQWTVQCNQEEDPCSTDGRQVVLSCSTRTSIDWVPWLWPNVSLCPMYRVGRENNQWIILLGCVPCYDHNGKCES
jgi:hypothetical protein